jgi:hypothetical protein
VTISDYVRQLQEDVSQLNDSYGELHTIIDLEHQEQQQMEERRQQELQQELQKMEERRQQELQQERQKMEERRQQELQKMEERRQQELQQERQKMDELRARLMALEVAAAHPRHVYVHIDSDMPVPLALHTSAAQVEGNSGVVLMTGIDLAANVSTSDS